METLITIAVTFLHPFAIGPVLLAQFLAWKWSVSRARKNYKDSKVLDGSLLFASKLFLISQVIFIAVLVPLLAVASGFLTVFFSPSWVLINVIASLISFWLALRLYHTKIIREESEQNVSQSSLPTNTGPALAYFLLGFVILTILFLLFRGHVALKDILLQFALDAGNITLIETFGEEYDVEDYYVNLAKEKQDITKCDEYYGTPSVHTVTIDDKYKCYVAADPAFAEYQKTCALYDKLGNLDNAHYTQRHCVIDQLYEKAKSVNVIELIDCDGIAQQFSNNIQIDYILEECSKASYIQQALIKNDPLICDSIFEAEPYLDEYDGNEEEHAMCVTNFIGSEQWKKGCALYGKTWNSDYREIAQCQKYFNEIDGYEGDSVEANDIVQ